jgi:hypothetical protein
MRRKVEESCFMGEKEETHEGNMKKKLYNQQGSYGQCSRYSKRERKKEMVAPEKSVNKTHAKV